MPLAFAEPLLMHTTVCTERLPSATLFTGNCSLHHLANNLQFGGINRWTGKGSQRRCCLPGCKGTSVYYCKKCNVGLHVECFELYDCK